MKTNLIKNLNIIFILIGHVKSMWTTCDQIGGENSNTGILRIDFKWGRFNKTTYVANGFFNITADFSNDYEFELKCYYSSKGNNQFRFIPYGIPKTHLCVYTDGHYYRSVIQPEFEKYSDLPKQIPDQPLCPLYKKGNYTFVNWRMDGHRSLPRYLNPGYYKIYTFYYQKRTKKILSKRSFWFKLT